MEVLFWGAAVVIGYVYAGYPLLLAGWARLAARPVRKAAAGGTDASWPSLSILIAARNEAQRLPARLTNHLELT